MIIFAIWVLIERSLAVTAPDTSAGEDWKQSPVIISGTGGSGTRGVVDVLSRMGIYLHPDPSTDLFKETYNGPALDNVVMYPESGHLIGMTDDGRFAGPSYDTWLRSGPCEPRPEAEPLRLGKAGHDFLNSVPFANRRPLRWGWKNPKAIFHLEMLLAVYPGAVLVHVVRHPLDMASSQWEHLQNRAAEFTHLQVTTPSQFPSPRRINVASMCKPIGQY